MTLALSSRKSLFPLSFLISAFLCAPAQAADFILEGGGGYYNIKTRTLLDSRYYHVVRQKYDFSCGSAALATLLTYSYQQPSDEQKIIKSMYEAGDKEKISHEGFSLLDMKNYLKKIGFHANGYKASLDKLRSVGIPAIALIKRKGYMHFVVVQGVEGDRVLLGDPALGKKIVDRKEFEQQWDNHILFIVEDNVSYAHTMFNSQAAWHVKAPGKFGMPLPDTDLAVMTLMTSYTPNSFRF